MPASKKLVQPPTWYSRRAASCRLVSPPHEDRTLTANTLGAGDD
jgi:hypothetical protein